MKNNYILVDYENVQDINLACIKDGNFYIKIFIGANQTKIPIELVLQSQDLGNRVEWLQVNGSGKNALDFHITFILGKLTEKDPTGFFHIISKDTGFDPLISYLKSRKIFCKRSDDISVIGQLSSQSLVVTENMTLEEICQIVIQKLTSIEPRTRPRSESALKNHIKSQLQLKETNPIIEQAYQKLLEQKSIYFNQAKKIEYGF